MVEHIELMERENVWVGLVNINILGQTRGKGDSNQDLYMGDNVGCNVYENCLRWSTR